MNPMSTNARLSWPLPPLLPRLGRQPQRPGIGRPAQNLAPRPGLGGAPMPGPLYGLYPQRPESAAPWRVGWAGSWLRRLGNSAAGADGGELARLRDRQGHWRRLGAAERASALRRLRARLSMAGFGQGPAARALRLEALACVAAQAQAALGRDPFDPQLQCAQVLLQGALAEMATGEGKSLAVALAAAVAALAGAPVHVMTANHYLAARDAQAHAPLFQALGLRVAAVREADGEDARRAAYAADIAYATARQVAFDHLRDRLRLSPLGGELAQRAGRLAAAGEPARLLLRGLCVALVDEADSLMIDEATMPLVLAEAADDPAHRAACFQALALARQLDPVRDAGLEPGLIEPCWSAEGLARLEALARPLGGAWLNRQHRLDLVGAAMVALHGLVPERDYLVREGRVDLLDATTGRAAPGRSWQRGLQTLVELKERCKPSPATRTTAQTTYPRFFARYWHVGGASGTLRECRAELAAAYGLSVVPIAPRQPSRLRLGRVRVFRDAQARTAAIAPRVRALQAAPGDALADASAEAPAVAPADLQADAQAVARADARAAGKADASCARPVLVACASVGAAEAVAAALAAAGLPASRLDARHAADEAAVVALAGRPGAITVATAMAGRGTDITLGPGVAGAGGLLVIVCQDNASARADRQLVGRAGRQGDPGGAERWLALDAEAWQGLPGRALLQRMAGPTGELSPGLAACAAGWVGLAQWKAQRSGQRQRWRQLLREDTWQTRLTFTALHA